MLFSLRLVTDALVLAEMPLFGWFIVVVLVLLGIWVLVDFLRPVGKDGPNAENNDTNDDYGGDDFGIFGGGDSDADDFDQRR